jgi:hypothetical protein
VPVLTAENVEPKGKRGKPVTREVPDDPDDEPGF